MHLVLLLALAMTVVGYQARLYSGGTGREIAESTVPEFPQNMMNFWLMRQLM